MSKGRKDNSFINKPNFEGGSEALKKFISTNMQYPEVALKHKIEGSVKIRFEINRYGKVGKAKVISTLGYGCDEEAVRLVKLLQFKMPKNPRKLKLLFHKNLTIHFKLPKIKSEPESSTIKYTVVKSTAAKPAPSDQNGHYNYTISN